MRTSHKIIIPAILIMASTGLNSCKKFLDKEPMSTVAPELYFNDAAQLETYVNRMYQDILPWPR